MAPKWMCCYFQANCGVEVIEKRNAVFKTECKIMGEVEVKFKSNQSETKNKDDVYTDYLGRILKFLPGMVLQCYKSI